MEFRQIAVDDIGYRYEDDTKQQYVFGTAVVYGQRTNMWDGFDETVQYGCFTDWLSKGHEIKSCYNHDMNYIMATTTSTPALTLNDTREGLMFSCPIPDTSYGRDLVDLLKRGVVKGASFTFAIDGNGGSWYEEDEDGTVHRIIKKAKLYELGAVASPAYVQTHVSLRDKESLIKQAKEFLNRNKTVDMLEQELENRNRNRNYLKLRDMSLRLRELSHT